jgi:hypothetical protein
MYGRCWQRRIYNLELFSNLPHIRHLAIEANA